MFVHCYALSIEIVFCGVAAAMASSERRTSRRFQAKVVQTDYLTEHGFKEGKVLEMGHEFGKPCILVHSICSGGSWIADVVLNFDYVPARHRGKLTGDQPCLFRIDPRRKKWAIDVVPRPKPGYTVWDLLERGASEDEEAMRAARTTGPRSLRIKSTQRPKLHEEALVVAEPADEPALDDSNVTRRKRKSKGVEEATEPAVPRTLPTFAVVDNQDPAPSSQLTTFIDSQPSRPPPEAPRSKLVLKRRPALDDCAAEASRDAAVAGDHGLRMTPVKEGDDEQAARKVKLERLQSPRNGWSPPAPENVIDVDDSPAPVSKADLAEAAESPAVEQVDGRAGHRSRVSAAAMVLSVDEDRPVAKRGKLDEQPADLRTQLASEPRAKKWRTRALAEFQPQEMHAGYAPASSSTALVAVDDVPTPMRRRDSMDYFEAGHYEDYVQRQHAKFANDRDTQRAKLQTLKTKMVEATKAQDTFVQVKLLEKASSWLSVLDNQADAAAKVMASVRKFVTRWIGEVQVTRQSCGKLAGVCRHLRAVVTNAGEGLDSLPLPDVPLWRSMAEQAEAVLSACEALNPKPRRKSSLSLQDPVVDREMQTPVKRKRRRTAAKVALPAGWHMEADATTGAIRYVNDSLGITQNKKPVVNSMPTVETHGEEACAEHCSLALVDFRRLTGLGGVLRHHRGLNIQDPWSKLIMAGIKTVEARRYPLKGYRDEELFLIETPGKSKLSRLSFEQLAAALRGEAVAEPPKSRRPRGLARPVKEGARITAIVRFRESYQYRDYEHWRADGHRHRVPPRSEFDWDPQQGPMYAWVVDSVQVLAEPQAGPAMKGVIGSGVVSRVALVSPTRVVDDSDTLI
eukprot:TRINITY_DN29850_c0_g1_i1.p1 TRINITY_DN29850_c0_g1~~TRINITY_DN29850_c0_g1_i1.p1  ORF type:complete len:853 (-),score=145.12 TRINITY_DN29850_c0_g1_i1:253-2811(-)